MSTPRERELLKQNRLLVRQEALAERELAKVIREMSGRIAERYSYGGEAAMLQVVDDHQPAIAAVLERRLLQTALIFGGRTLDRIAANIPKSYYPGLQPGTGPVRGGAEDMVEYAIFGSTEAKGARDVFEGSIARWVKEHALRRAVTVTGTIKEAVRGVLLEALGDGQGEAGTVKLIRERIGKRLSATNAARIARTEMHTASTMGADEAARSTGLELIKEWASAEDSRTRASHAQADGQEVALDAPFTVGTARLMVPGDPSGPAKEIINCRCAILHHPVIAGVVIRGDGAPPSPPRTAPPAVLKPQRKPVDVLEEESRSHVLENGRANGVEFLTAYDAKSGKEFAPMRGGVDYCQLSPEMIAACDDPKARIVLHHNHPSSSSFSRADLGFIARVGVEAIFAHGHDGSSYKASAGKKKITASEMATSATIAQGWLQDMINLKVMTVEEAIKLSNHVAWLVLHRRERVTYEAKLAGENLAVATKFAPLIAEFIGEP